MTNKWNIDTKLIHTSQSRRNQTEVVSQAIVPAVAYSFPDTDTAAAIVAGDEEGVFYGRLGNPTTRTLERKIANLEGAEDALGVSSGMAAISIALLTYLNQGDHVLVTKDIYGGTYKFLSSFAPRYGIQCDFVDCTNLAEVAEAIKENPKVLYIETPSNPCLTILDIQALSALAHRHNIAVIIDNTFMTPYLQRPLELGADVVVHSATKYLNGHGDVVAGFIVGNKKTMEFMRHSLMADLGQPLNAWEAYLILRGLKTLGLRMQRHNDSAQKIAQYLEEHPQIAKVYYPGLTSHPQHGLAVRQMSGMGGIISFEVQGGLENGKRFINALQLILISFSLGDPETLIQHPATMTHASIPPAERMKFGITDGLMRLSVGLEDPEDIIRDIEQALYCITTEHVHG